MKRWENDQWKKEISRYWGTRQMCGCGCRELELRHDDCMASPVLRQTTRRKSSAADLKVDWSCPFGESHIHGVKLRPTCHDLGGHYFKMGWKWSNVGLVAIKKMNIKLPEMYVQHLEPTYYVLGSQFHLCSENSSALSDIPGLFPLSVVSCSDLCWFEVSNIVFSFNK